MQGRGSGTIRLAALVLVARSQASDPWVSPLRSYEASVVCGDVQATRVPRGGERGRATSASFARVHLLISYFHHG
jgi:hypothetical protein